MLLAVMPPPPTAPLNENQPLPIGSPCSMSSNTSPGAVGTAWEAEDWNVTAVIAKVDAASNVVRRFRVGAIGVWSDDSL